MNILTINEIMAEYKVGRRTATHWANKCGGMLDRVPGGKIRVRKAALDRYLGGKQK